MRVSLGELEAGPAKAARHRFDQSYWRRVDASMYSAGGSLTIHREGGEEFLCSTRVGGPAKFAVFMPDAGPFTWRLRPFGEGDLVIRSGEVGPRGAALDLTRAR